MKIKYIGKEFTEVFGLAFKPGETLEVTDPYAAEKLARNPNFKGPDEATNGPPKALTPTDALVRLTEKARADQMAAVNQAIISDIERKKREG